MAGVIQDKDGRIHMVDESGSAVSVTPQEYAQARQAGWRPQSLEEFNSGQIQKERGTLTEQAKTFGEGALEGATLGLGTAAATALGGDEYRQAALERAQTNPGARMAGQVAGAVAPGLLSGGEGTIASLARATPAGMVGRLGGAVEGAVTGGLGRLGLGAESGVLGYAASRAAALGAQGAAEGAAYGLGSSLAESALEGTDWTAERALSGLEDGALYGLGTGAALGAGGAVVSRAGKAALESMLGEGKGLRQAVQDFADKRTVRGLVGDDAEAFRKITRNGEDMGRIGELAEKIRARGVAEAADVPGAVQIEIDAADNVARGIEQQAEAQGIRPQLGTLLDDVRQQANEIQSGLTPDHRQVARMIRKRVGELERVNTVKVAHPDGTVTTELRNPSFEELRDFKTSLGQITNFAKAHKNVAASEASKLYGKVAQTLEQTAEELGPEAGAAYQGAMRDMDDFITIRSGMKREVTRQARAKFMQGSDTQAGIGGALAALVMGHGGPMAAIAGIASSAASKLIRERGSQAVGKLADWALNAEKTMGAAAEKIVTGKTANEAALRSSLQARPGAEEQDFDAVQKQLVDFQRDPGTMLAKVERTIGPIAHEQPEVASAMATRIVGDMQYLSSLAPKPMTRADNSLTPLKEQPIWTGRDKLRVVRSAQALAAPRSVFASIANGHINWDGIDALKERRPKMWEDMRAHVIKQVATAPEPLAYRKRVTLGLAFDFNADWCMANVSTIQASVNRPAPGGGNGKPAVAGVSTTAMDLPGQKVNAA